MRKSTGDLVWHFLALCNDRKAFEKIRQLRVLTEHDVDGWVIEKICEYQLLLPSEEFMRTGFVGCSA